MSDNETNILCVRLLNKYRACSSIRYLLNHLSQQQIDILINKDVQLILYNLINNDSVTKQYPCSQLSIANFWHDYTNFVIKHTNNDDNNTNNVLIESLQKPRQQSIAYKNATTSNTDEVYYKTLTYCDNVNSNEYTISCIVYNSHSTTIGLAIWPAALITNAYILHNKHEFYNRRILELGAGTGISSILLHTTGTQHIECTDYEHNVLNACKLNFDNNFCRLCGCNNNNNNNTTQQQQCHCTYQVTELDWSKMNEQQISTIQPDIIIAADCAYIPEEINFLATTVFKILSYTHSNAYCLFIQKERNPMTFTHYVSELHNIGLTLEQIDTSNMLQYIDEDVELINDVFIHKAYIRR